MEKTTPQILSMFMGAANRKENERHSDTVQVDVCFSPFCLSPHIRAVHIIICIRSGRPAGAHFVWGGGDSVRKCSDVSVAAGPGGHRGQCSGSLSAEVPHRHPGCCSRLQEAVRESETGTLIGCLTDTPDRSSFSHISSVSIVFHYLLLHTSAHFSVSCRIHLSEESFIFQLKSR